MSPECNITQPRCGTNWHVMREVRNLYLYPGKTRMTTNYLKVREFFQLTLKYLWNINIVSRVFLPWLAAFFPPAQTSMPPYAQRSEIRYGNRGKKDKEKKEKIWQHGALSLRKVSPERHTARSLRDLLAVCRPLLNSVDFLADFWTPLEAETVDTKRGRSVMGWER